MKFDESKDKTQKYDDAKSTHFIISILIWKVEYQKEIDDQQTPSQYKLEFSAHLFRVFPTSSDQQPQNQ